MTSALSSFDNSITSFINSDYGLSVVDVTYIEFESEIEYPDLKATRQEKDSKYFQRKITKDKQADHEIFLMNLSFKASGKPEKNDKVKVEDDIYYIDHWEQVSPSNYRLYCLANLEQVAQPSGRFSL